MVNLNLVESNTDIVTVSSSSVYVINIDDNLISKCTDTTGNCHLNLEFQWKKSSQAITGKFNIKLFTFDTFIFMIYQHL